jgi:hypothetical protein
LAPSRSLEMADAEADMAPDTSVQIAPDLRPRACFLAANTSRYHVRSDGLSKSVKQRASGRRRAGPDPARTGPSRTTARTRHGAACASRLVQVDKAIEDPALDLDLSCRHPMITFFSAQHHLHALTHEFFRGERVPCFESPSRADLVRAEVAARGHEVRTPTSDSRGVLAKVHAPRYLTFLESAGKSG